MQIDEILNRLKHLAPPAGTGMKRLGLKENALGVSMTSMRKLAHELGGNDHALAALLWNEPVHESRLLACLLEDPSLVTIQQAELWANSFDSWLLCDQCCNELLWKTPFARHQAIDWTEREEELVKRAGFSLIAALACFMKEDDIGFFDFSLFCICKHAGDTRPYVRQGIARALRQIGKHNTRLHEAALETTEEIRLQPSKEARWIARQVLADLKSSRVQQLLEQID